MLGSRSIVQVEKEGCRDGGWVVMGVSAVRALQTLRVRFDLPIAKKNQIKDEAFLRVFALISRIPLYVAPIFLLRQ